MMRIHRLLIARIEHAPDHKLDHVQRMHDCLLFAPHTDFNRLSHTGVIDIYV